MIQGNAIHYNAGFTTTTLLIMNDLCVHSCISSKRTKDKENPQEKKINRARWTVQDKIQFLSNILKDTEEINFFSLFDETYSKMEIITVFMAILEMLKFQKIEVVQAERYADIKIKRKEAQSES